MFDEFFSKAHELIQAGVPFATATVVRAEKPTSGKPGDRAIITADGALHGWIGGSCAQPTVVQEALKALAEDECRLLRLSTEAQPARAGVVDLPMTCFSGGTMEIYIEPQPPRPRLLIVGALPVARALAQLARAMNYHVMGLDLDGEALPGAHQIIPDLDALPEFLSPSTYVVVATHGNYDEAALERLLTSDVAYVGLVASRRRAESVRDYLAAQGIPESALAVLKAPAGLDIGARRGDEIALSIMAEIVERRRGHESITLEEGGAEDSESEERRVKSEETAGAGTEGVGGRPVSAPRDSTGGEDAHGPPAVRRTVEPSNVSWGIPAPSHHLEPESHPDHDTRVAGIAIDPICHMNVNIATARYRSRFEGEEYYFCCAGCKRTFDSDPARYAGDPSTRV